jgi:uncharacterized protein (TIGR02145 family)
MQFTESLKNWFYRLGSNEASLDARACLLDSSGNAIGSDNLKRVMSYAMTKDDCVDMGLPSGRLWAKCNLGAVSPEGSGMYFSWGNLEPHQKDQGYDFSQAVYDNTTGASILTDLTLEQDAAHCLLGGLWHMPSKDDFQELYDNCTTAWTTNYNSTGIAGRVFTSKNNSNTLFFPAAGFYNGTTLSGEGSNGYYWSSSFSSATYAYRFGFSSSGVNPQSGNSRRSGFSVRPVQ